MITCTKQSDCPATSHFGDCLSMEYRRVDPPAAPTWIDVEQSQPEARQEVLFVAEFGGEPIVCFGCKAYPGEDRKWYDLANTDRDGDPTEVYGVTHWMPLPDPPQYAQSRPLEKFGHGIQSAAEGAKP